jgi:hypothetical protein
VASAGELGLQIEMALTELENAARTAEATSESCAQARDLCSMTFEGSGNQTALDSIPLAQELATRAFELRQGVNDLWDKLRTVRGQL